MKLSYKGWMINAFKQSASQPLYPYTAYVKRAGKAFNVDHAMIEGAVEKAKQEIERRYQCNN